MTQIFSPNDLANISRCAAFAALSHKGQKRYVNHNGGGYVPYIVHPARVATLVALYRGSPEAVMASWLHDVKEDCPDAKVADFIESIPMPEISKYAVYGYVIALTKDASIKDRMERLESHIDLITLWDEPVLIKICDRIDNLTVTEYEDNKKRIEGMDGDQFVRMYVKESDYLLKNLLPYASKHGYMEPWLVLKEIIEELKKNDVVAVPNHNTQGEQD